MNMFMFSSVHVQFTFFRRPLNTPLMFMFSSCSVHPKPKRFFPFFEERAGHEGDERSCARLGRHTTADQAEHEHALGRKEEIW